MNNICILFDVQNELSLSLLLLVQRSTVHIIHLDVHSLVLSVVLYGGQTVLSANPGHLVTSERQLSWGQVEGVDVSLQ